MRNLKRRSTGDTKRSLEGQPAAPDERSKDGEGEGGMRGEWQRTDHEGPGGGGIKKEKKVTGPSITQCFVEQVGSRGLKPLDLEKSLEGNEKSKDES